MARGECTFRQRDVEAALRAARNAGVDIARIEIGKDGRIVMTTGNGAEPNKQQEGDDVNRAGGNPWDTIV
jgi:hypothetical protein